MSALQHWSLYGNPRAQGLRWSGCSQSWCPGTWCSDFWAVWAMCCQKYPLCPGLCPGRMGLAGGNDTGTRVFCNLLGNKHLFHPALSSLCWLTFSLSGPLLPILPLQSDCLLASCFCLLVHSLASHLLFTIFLVYHPFIFYPSHHWILLLCLILHAQDDFFSPSWFN